MKNFKKLLLVSSAAAALSLAGASQVEAAYQADLDGDGVVEWVYDDGSSVLADGWYRAEQLRGSGIANSATEVLPASVTQVVDPDLFADDAPYYSPDPVDGSVEYQVEVYVESGHIVDSRYGVELRRVDATHGTQYIPSADAPLSETENTQSNPTGENGTVNNPSESTHTPEVIEQQDEISWHAPQQNDSEIRGHIRNDEVTYIEIRKNGEVIAVADVDPDGYFTAVLQKAIEYGNDIEVWAFNSAGNRIYAVSDVASVDYVAVAHTPNPIRLEAITTDGSLTADANHVRGYTRPYNKVYIRVYDPTNQTYTNDWIVAYADANGLFDYDLGSLAKDGFEVHLYTEDSSGNVSETQTLFVNDDSTVEAAVVRRTHAGDNAVTVRSYPYAWVTVEVVRGGDVIGTFQGRADGNGIARINLLNRELKMDDKLNIFADVEGRPSGQHVHYVRLAEDTNRPEAPEVDEVVEGSTILKGTAEAYALVSARWLEDGTLNWTEIFTLADENGNFLFDLFEYGLSTPFREGVEVLVRAHDNNLNHNESAVSVMPAGTPTIGTELPIEANPDGGDLVDGDKDEEDDKDKDPKPVKPGKPGKKDKADAATLPETGESSSYLVFGAAALSILAGLGLVAPKFKKED